MFKSTMLLMFHREIHSSCNSFCSSLASSGERLFEAQVVIITGISILLTFTWDVEMTIRLSLSRSCWLLSNIYCAVLLHLCMLLGHQHLFLCCLNFLPLFPVIFKILIGGCKKLGNCSSLL